MVEAVDHGAVPLAHEVLTLEVDLGDQQASQMKRADRGREAAIGRISLERVDIEDDRDALVPGIELVAGLEWAGREKAEGKLVGFFHLKRPINEFRTNEFGTRR